MSNIVDKVIPIPETGIGDVSDGYHTFNELYHHRAVLFSVICSCFPFLAWKSKLHHDGSMYDNMFIVGIYTPEGPATYHYNIDPYWDMFDVEELPKAPEWDGHSPSEAIERIHSLIRYRKVGHWIPIYTRFVSKHSPTGTEDLITKYKCSECGLESKSRYYYCHCGSLMIDGCCRPVNLSLDMVPIIRSKMEEVDYA